MSELFKGMIKRRHPGFGAGLGTVEPAKALDGALSVVYIVLDDVGFSANGRRGVLRPQPLFLEMPRRRRATPKPALHRDQRTSPTNRAALPLRFAAPNRVTASANKSGSGQNIRIGTEE